jgi:antitoxin component YwqK of YwqJK toxin-antitoxin module
MEKTVAILILAFIAVATRGQNQLDQQGRKTGPWKVEYEDGQTRYEGTFREGKPVGLMIRYYNTGVVQARLEFDPDSDRSRSVLFHKNGKKAAEGNYLGKEKDSVWNYYSALDGTLRIREGYDKGKLQGISCRFYPNGTVSEEISWDQGVREGPWLQYYEEGTVRLRGSYEDDKLNGAYQVYHNDSTLVISGFYDNDLSAGTWMFFDDSGNLVDSLEYRGGIPVDQEKYHRLILEDSLMQQYPDREPQPFQP